MGILRKQDNFKRNYTIRDRNVRNKINELGLKFSEFYYLVKLIKEYGINDRSFTINDIKEKQKRKEFAYDYDVKVLLYRLKRRGFLISERDKKDRRLNHYRINIDKDKLEKILEIYKSLKHEIDNCKRKYRILTDIEESIKDLTRNIKQQ